MEVGSSAYITLHAWVRRILGKPLYCEHCGSTDGKPSQYDWANVSKEYKRDIKDWIRLCKKCHRKFDNPLGLCRKKLHVLAEQLNPKVDKDGYIECRPCRNAGRRAHYHKKKLDKDWYEHKKAITRKASLAHYYRNKESNV